MFKTLRQAQSAFSHLNPATVRELSTRPVYVGLIASTTEGYEAMEELLIPAAAPEAERRRGWNALYRGGDPHAPAKVDLVLYEQGIPLSDGTYVLYQDDPSATLKDVLEDHPEFELPLARQFPGLRKLIVERIVSAIARENAMFAITTALPDMIPSFIELPWAFGEWASDTAFLTANEIRMAFMIAGACGGEIGFTHQKAQVLSIGAGAFGLRALARELSGKIPMGGGLVAKGAIAFAGTYVMGKALALAEHGNVNYSREEKRALYQDAYERGREMARSLVPLPKGRG
jgi:hypothetical protein